MSRRNGDIKIAMKIYEQTYSTFRHWDQIRWLVPYWFITITAVGAAIFQHINNPNVVKVFGSLIFVFSCLCFFLMYNTIKYHNKSISNFREKMKYLNITSKQKKAICEPFLPFKFDDKGILCTSTVSFMFFILVLGIISLIVAICPEILMEFSIFSSAFVTVMISMGLLYGVLIIRCCYSNQ
jgi:hypothetical protein